MSLLTPTESHAFPNLVDYHQIQHEHQHPHHLAQHQQQHVAEWPMTHSQHSNDALARATKDLMALDADNWPPQQNHQNQSHHSNYYYHHAPPQPRRNVTFPFLAKPAALAIPSPVPQYVNSPTASTSSASSYSYQLPATPASPTSPDQPIRSSRSPKRSLDVSAVMPERKRQRPTLSQTHSLPPYSRLPASPVLPSLPPAMTSSKPALLSPSQKKANHIQSEQKRRANIRRGYEALCESVPALREAIRAEEEALTAGRDAKSIRSRRGKGRAAAVKVEEQEQTTGEKSDGRAGPRSENVVLLKTIDYINELVAERSDLLNRLDNARNALPPNHPALIQQSARTTLWERQWRGGEPKDEEEEEVEEE